MVYDDAPDTVGYTDVTMFDTTGYRNPSRDDSRQYEQHRNRHGAESPRLRVVMVVSDVYRRG